MAPKAYVLINTEVGKAEDVAQGVERAEGVKSADVVRGGYDVVATVEVARLSAVLPIVEQIRSVPGVRKTTTLLKVKS